MSKWLKFLGIIAILAMIPAVVVFMATLFLKIAIITVCVGLIVLLAVLQILGKITLRKMLWWIASIVAIMIIVIWYPWEKGWNANVVPAKTTSLGIQTVRPTEEWVFNWRLPPGQMDGGRNRHTLEVEITRNDQEALWAVLHDKGNSGEDVSVGGLRLAKNGDDLIGTWNNYLSDDGGKCYLYKQGANQCWSGHYELKDGSRTDCTLKRK